MTRNLVLVDTSVWVNLFRARLSEMTIELEKCLAENRAMITPIIKAEILSGAKNDSDYRDIGDSLGAVLLTQDPPDLWGRVALARFKLAKKGIQSQMIDLSIAVTAHYFDYLLLSSDKHFRHISREISIKFL